jgi:hypothetical protein
MSRTIDEVHRENDMMRKARLAEKKRNLDEIAKWSSSGHILLHAGEMTAGELRTVKAVVGAIYSAIQDS